MRSTLSEASWRSKACKKLTPIFEKWWARYIFGPLLVSIPPALALGYLRLPKVRAYLDGILPVPLGSFLATHEVQLFFLAVFWSYALVALYGAVQGCAKASEEIDTVGLLALFETIEKVVGAKADRFEAATRTLAANASAGDVFSVITQPDQQIALLGAGLHGFFESLEKEVAFKVSIAAITDGKPTEWFYYAPPSDPPRTSIETLRRPESAICQAVRRKDLVIVEDFHEELRKGSEKARYVTENTNDCDEGSLLCYPLLRGKSGKIPLVVTVVADRKGYFSHKKRQLYIWILKRFAVRMQLELHLQSLKERVAPHAKVQRESENKPESN